MRSTPPTSPYNGADLGDEPDPDALYVNDPAANPDVDGAGDPQAAADDTPADGAGAYNVLQDINVVAVAAAGDDDDATPTDTDDNATDITATVARKNSKTKTGGLGRLFGKFGRKKGPSKVHEGTSPLVPVHKKNEVFGECV